MSNNDVPDLTITNHATQSIFNLFDVLELLHYLQDYAYVFTGKLVIHGTYQEHEYNTCVGVLQSVTTLVYTYY